MMHTIILPDVGQTKSEVRVLRWLKKLGDKVAKGEVLVEVETDKANMEVEAYVGGYLREVLVKEGEMASAMAPVGILTDDPKEFYESPRKITFDDPSSEQSFTLGPSVKKIRGRRIVAVPVARSLARELGLNLNLIEGTGPGGLITRKDVEYCAARKVRPTTPVRTTREQLSATAALLTQSKLTIPHFYVTVDVSVDTAEAWRRSWNASHPGLAATMNDVFVRVAGRALRDVPQMNVSYSGGKYEQRSSPDVLVAVGVEAGLRLVPIVAPDSLSWQEYLAFMKENLGVVPKGETLKAFSNCNPLLAISNLGMFGVKQFAAIIPPTCTAILAVGSISEEPVAREQKVMIDRVCSLTLSADHRIVDGIIAANFLQRLQAHLDSL